MFHVNMLKEFKVRQKISSNYQVETTAEVQGVEEDIVFWKDGEPSDQPTISDHLKADQKEQLNTEFAQVFQNQPGCTPLVQHKIETGVVVQPPHSSHNSPFPHALFIRKHYHCIPFISCEHSNFLYHAHPLVIFELVPRSPFAHAQRVPYIMAC